MSSESPRPTGATIWFTGLPASGKSATAGATAQLLVAKGFAIALLDGDELRAAMTTPLGFSRDDRAIAVRRAGELALSHAKRGAVAVTALVSPYEADRRELRRVHERQGVRFLEIFIDTPLETCIARDPKGLYAKALAGELPMMTGIDDPYEVPSHPDLRLTPEQSPEDNAQEIFHLLFESER